MPSVLVTGASTGIGEACARRLVERGYLVFAGVRRVPDQAPSSAADGRLRWLELDVTRADQIAAAAARIGAELGDRGLDGLVNNAGVGVGGPLEYLPLDEFRHQFEVNVFGLLAVTQAMLPLLRRSRGRIVNIGSIAGRTVTALTGPYSASKHAVEAVTDALRLELAEWGIQVSVVEPGAVKTPIWDKGKEQLEEASRRYPREALDRYRQNLELLSRIMESAARRGVSPNEVAAAVLHALEARRPKTRYLVGRDARLRALLARFLPDRANDAILRFYLDRVRRKLAR
jgi:NAD(P)-dependent dehydrogenase (short-subunit alcohol dehydrogenase family)